MKETEKRGQKKRTGRGAGGWIAGCTALLALGLVLILIGQWRMEEPEQAERPAEAPPETAAAELQREYSVSFRLGEETLQSFLLPAGESVPAYDPELPGLKLEGWLDEAGPADPWAGPVSGDRVFTAAVTPTLLRHVSFLFADENGLLRPDEAMDEAALNAAAEALLPEGSAEETALLRQQLDEIGRVSASRRDFARRIAGINGWTADERLRPAEGAIAPADLDPKDADFALLLEASVPHTADESGKLWTEAPLQTAMEPGMLLRGTELYCVGEDGFLLRDEDVGPLHFGPDGRFTSGDAELDGYVTECLGALQEEFPEDAADRFAMLRHCYDYVRDSYVYLGRGHKMEEGVDWSIEDAKIMFSSGKGNCYNYAAVFRALARRLGYPANTVLRSLDTPDNEHAWTDLVIRGIPYVFDPQLEKHFGNDRWMLRYEDAKKYGYTRPDPAVFLGYEAYTEMEYHQPPEQEGEVIEVEGEGDETYLIYLPYGYDPDKQYRVLIYLNGADGDPFKMLGSDYRYSHGNVWFGCAVNTKYYIDYLIQEGYCDPLIVVSTNETIAEWIGDRYLRLIQYTVDHYSTYANSSEIEDLVAARDYFAIAGPSNASQSICLAIQTMPDIFAYYGLFSGMYRPEETLAAFREKGPIRFLMMAAGEQDYQWPVMTETYEVWSQLDNVQDSCLMIVPGADHDWVAFDAAIRHMLFYFSPKTK